MKGVCDNLFMKRNSFAPVRNKNSHFRSSSLHRVQQPLAMKNYSIKTDRNAPKLFEHPPNQGRKMLKTFINRWEHRLLHGEKCLHGIQTGSPMLIA